MKSWVTVSDDSNLLKEIDRNRFVKSQERKLQKLGFSVQIQLFYCIIDTVETHWSALMWKMQ